MESRENLLNAKAQLEASILKKQELLHTMDKRQEKLPELLPLIKQQAVLQIDLELAEVKLLSARRNSETAAEMAALDSRLRALRGEPALSAELDSTVLAEAEAEYEKVKSKLKVVRDQIAHIESS